jgi:hypothetical protein
MDDFEARAIEEALGIPTGWMDENGWVKSGWSLIKEFRTLSPASRRITNEVGSFVRLRVQQ